MATLLEYEQRLRDEIPRHRLIGEIPLEEAELDDICSQLRRLSTHIIQRQYPHCLAAVLVNVAKFRYDGHEYWPKVRSLLDTPGYEINQPELGQWFADYLERNHLPTFRQLVEEGALPYVTPILAHAMVPRALVPSFMEHVIWPSITDPERYGYDISEIRERLIRNHAGMHRPVYRFVVYGGRVAEDVIQRTMDLVHGIDDPGLPSWFVDEVSAWVDGRGQQRSRVRQRWTAPALVFDPEFVRILLRLPYIDSPVVRWKVQLSGGSYFDVPWKESWRRPAPYEELLVEEPFSSIQVFGFTENGLLTSRSFEGLTPERPFLLFHGKSCKAISGTRTLSTRSFFLVAPAGACVQGADGEIGPVEDLGEPASRWRSIVARHFELPDGLSHINLSAGRAQHQVFVDADAEPVLDCPDVPAYLEPYGETALAFETNLPSVILPGPPGHRDAADYLASWTVSVRSDDGTERGRMSAAELSPELLPGGRVRLHLEDLIPGRDVGRWHVRVNGPLGRSAEFILDLLPAMEFQVDEHPGVAGPDLAVSTVDITTRDGISVLEEGDFVEPRPDGWRLYDRNRNGRIPFTVRDTATGRETMAAIRLNVAQWRWVGRGLEQQEDNTALRFNIDDLESGSAGVLLARVPPKYDVELRLVQRPGRILQRLRARAKQKNLARFSISEFLDTLRGSHIPNYDFELQLLSSNGNEVGSPITVATVDIAVDIEHVSAAHPGHRTTLSWIQRRPVPGAHGTIRCLTRPWQEPLSSPVSYDNTTGTASIEVSRLLPGRYSLELRVDDEWTGQRTVGRIVQFHIGSEDDLRKRADVLPPTVAGTLERILLTSPNAAADETRAFFRDLGPYQLRELLAIVAKSVDCGAMREILRIPWWLAAESLASRKSADARQDFWQWLVDQDGTSRPGCLLVGLGIERWQGQVPGEMIEGREDRLWQAWLPLGAWHDLALARNDPGAVARCHTYLGWPDLETDDSDGDAFESLPECGSINGPEFQPDDDRLEAMEAALLPVPGRMFDRDGWLNAAFATLKQLSRHTADGEFEQRRRRLVRGYLSCREPLERMADELLGPGGLDRRWMLPQRVLPESWPVLGRMSLAVALVRRQMARGKRGSLPPEAVPWLDEVAVWLERYMPRIYERDLCYAEILCLRVQQ